MTDGIFLILENNSELQELIVLLGENGPISSENYELPDEWSPFIDEAIDEYNNPYFDLTKRGKQIYEEFFLKTHLKNFKRSIGSNKSGGESSAPVSPNLLRGLAKGAKK